MTQTFRAVIFDLDGVLADSEPSWDKIDAQLLKEYGADYHGEYHREVLGVSYKGSVEFFKKTFHISAPTEEMMKRRGEIAAEFFATRVGLFPRVKEVLEQLSGAGDAVVGRLCQTPGSVGVSQKRPTNRMKLALATSSVGASARPFLDRHQLTGFFEVIVTGDEVEHGKPEPDIYLCAAEKLGVAADECLVVEDSLSGIAAGKAAQMRVAAIPDRRFVDPREYEKQTDYLLNDLSEIPALVRDAAKN